MITSRIIHKDTLENCHNKKNIVCGETQKRGPILKFGITSNSTTSKLDYFFKVIV